MQPTANTSARMKKVRQKNTGPELTLRKILHRLGAHFRICPKGLPGHPDVANQKKHWAIFIHGCFWHGHENCKLFSVPRTNQEFWKTKIADNRARDTRKEKELRALGFRVEVIWQCEIEAMVGLEDRLRRFLKQQERSGRRLTSRRRTATPSIDKDKADE